MILVLIFFTSTASVLRSVTGFCVKNRLSRVGQTWFVTTEELELQMNLPLTHRHRFIVTVALLETTRLCTLVKVVNIRRQHSVEMELTIMVAISARMGGHVKLTRT